MPRVGLTLRAKRLQSPLMRKTARPAVVLATLVCSVSLAACHSYKDTAIKGVRDRMIASRSRNGLSVLSDPCWASFEEGEFIFVAPHINANTASFKEKSGATVWSVARRRRRGESQIKLVQGQASS